jgi:CRISPR system Cascade subunit CasE
MSDSLYMAQMTFDYKGLLKVGKDHGLNMGMVTDDYLVHSALKELFGDFAPGPFNIEGRPDQSRQVEILAYSDVPADRLASVAQLDARPVAFDMCDWDLFATKPMPTGLPEGLSLNFNLRAATVLRASSGGRGTWSGEEITWEAGSEHDAFLYRQAQSEEPLDRIEVYKSWLSRQFENRDGAVLQSANLRRWRLTDCARRDSDRSFRKISLPDVTFGGTLKIVDTDAFMDLVQSGIGRHKSFGFGMIRLSAST